MDNKKHKQVWYEGPPFKKVLKGIKGRPISYSDIRKSKAYPVGKYPEFKKVGE